MKKRTIVFSYNRGWNDVIEDEFEFDFEATDEDIADDFERWVWEQVGDNVGWLEKE